jgi:F-type H+-transporting ATPase subunit gamma
VSRRRSLEEHRERLEEIREIMDSMQSLAYIETQTIPRRLRAQRAVMRTIDKAAQDLLGAFPANRLELRSSARTLVVVGTERGFCGDLNELVLREARRQTTDGKAAPPRLVLVGRKLATRTADEMPVAATVPGAGAAEEIPVVVDALVQAAADPTGTSSISALYPDPDQGIVQRSLMPPFVEPLEETAPQPVEPVLNLPPGELLAELAEQMLFAAFHEILLTSLLAETQRRILHLDGAVRRLEDETTELSRRANALRQEEIIEEIEVILLNASTRP